MAGVRDGNSQYFLNFSGSPEFFRFFCKSEIYVFPMWNTEILPKTHVSFYHGKPSKAAVVNSQLVRMMMMMMSRRSRLAKPSCRGDCLSETKPAKPSQASRQEKKGK